MRTTDRSGNWGVGESFDEVKAQMERETYEQIKCALKFSLINLQGETLTKTAAKLHEDYLSGNQEDKPVLIDQGLPIFSYKGFCITIDNAVWTFEGDEDEFTHRDLLAGLQAVDSIQEERG